MVSKCRFPAFYIALFLLCLLFSCGKKQTGTVKLEDNTLIIAKYTIGTKTDSAKLASALIVKEVQIDTFSTFPPEIEGCACYYSNNKKDFDNEIYIYADDYNDNAFVWIDGKLTRFTLSKVDTLPHKRTILTWKNKQYELTIDRIQVGQIEETWQQEGTLVIKEIGGKETRKRIYGECGC